MSIFGGGLPFVDGTYLPWVALTYRTARFVGGTYCAAPFVGGTYRAIEKARTYRETLRVI